MTKNNYYVIIIIFLLSLSLGWFLSDNYKNFLDPDTSLPSWNRIKPLDKYSIENLSKTEIKPVDIHINGNIFDFSFDPTLEYKDSSKIKKVTGLVNTPATDSPQPLAVLVRGYVDQSIYQTGVGTKRVGEYLADNGYITLAPDFLGYGGSDSEAGNIFESRFQTYTTLLTLLKSIESPAQAKALSEAGWDGKNIVIWAHSNGGQIALTTLEITGDKYPTVLWAPVTESFPYSVLFYTNESDDGGKFIRRELAKFEKDYDTDKYSLTKYLDKINAPIEYHWGTNDDAISVEWKDRFVNKMKSLNKDFTNYNHSGADHNMVVTSSAYHNMNPLWSDVMKETLDFFNKKLY